MTLDAAIRLRRVSRAKYPTGFGGDHNADVTQLITRGDELSFLVERELLKVIAPTLTAEGLCERGLR